MNALLLRPVTFLKSLILLVILGPFFPASTACADEDLLDAILKAHQQSCEKMESAIGTGTLEGYRKVAERAIARGADKTGVQAERLKLIKRALDDMK